MGVDKAPGGAGGLLPRILSAARATGQRVYLAGGLLRDRLLGVRAPGEWDLNVAEPRALLAALELRPGETAFPLDPERETFRLALPAARRIAQIDLTRLRAPAIEADLRLRDFTVNAIAVELLPGGRCGPLIDPTGGIADCRRRVLRVCGPRAIADDPLRALRGVRLAVNRGLRIAPQTARLLRRGRIGLRQVSPERVRDELFRILEGSRPAWGVALALRLGLLAGVGLRVSGAPALRNTRRVAALAGKSAALRRRLDEPLEQGVTRRGLLLLAALLVDLGLAPRAPGICARLMLGNRATRIAVTAARTALPRSWYRRPTAAAREPLLDFFAAADHAALETVVLHANSAAEARALLQRYTRVRRIFQRPALLGGAIAMRELQLDPGPQLGRLLAATRRAQDLGHFRGAAGALRFARRLGAPARRVGA